MKRGGEAVVVKGGQLGDDENVLPHCGAHRFKDGGRIHPISTPVRMHGPCLVSNAFTHARTIESITVQELDA